MIFYTLQGLAHELEIHEDKIRLTKRPWFELVTRKAEARVWSLEDLVRFEVTEGGLFLIQGRLSWKVRGEERESFRFLTNVGMARKIEAYFQRKVLSDRPPLRQLKAA